MQQTVKKITHMITIIYVTFKHNNWLSEHELPKDQRRESFVQKDFLNHIIWDNIKFMLVLNKYVRYQATALYYTLPLDSGGYYFSLL